MIPHTLFRPVTRVAWAVPPGAKAETRPARLIDELTQMGAITSDAFRDFHGAAPSTGSSVNRGRLCPRIPADGAGAAVLSPVFEPPGLGFAWMDCYDDWSIAPDINPVHRWRARRTYEWARRLPPTVRSRLTVNSRYMAGRLGVPDSQIVPNGLSSEYADHRPTGDDARRLVLLGHFFRGRTDVSLVADVVTAGDFDEVVIGGGGGLPGLIDIVRTAASRRAARIVERAWIPPAELAGMVGPRTVGLLPHVVSDYTLSQDPMKLYQFLGLGVRVIAPRMLWPSHLPVEHAYLVDFGIDLSSTLVEWIESAPIAEYDRRSFIEDNSWRSRATRLVRILAQAS